MRKPSRALDDAEPTAATEPGSTPAGPQPLEALQAGLGSLSERLQRIAAGDPVPPELARELLQLEHAARDAWVVAHELRNPLHTISLQLAGLKHSLAGAPEGLRSDLERGLQLVEEETLRLRDLLEHFLRLGRRPPELHRTRIELRDLLDGVLRFYRTPLDQAGIHVELRLPAEPISLRVDAAQISQVLHNLLRNALDAMPEGGRLDVSARSTAAGIEVRLDDSGPGFQDPELAFAYFASTRPGGTGLGLPVSREILRAHGGELSIRRVPTGASLLLSLPTDDPGA